MDGTRVGSAPSSVIEPEHVSEQETLDSLVRRYFPMVYATCWRYTHNRHDAEDAAQATFLCLAMQLRQQRVIRSPGPWLYQVATRTAQDLYRRRNNRNRHESACGSLQYYDRDLPDPDAQIDMAELRPKVVEALNDLPVRYRLPLILFYFGGLTHEDLAKELKCTRGSLRVRLHRGHRMLRKALEDQGVSLAGASLTVIVGTAVQMEISDSLLASTTGLSNHVSHYGLASCQLPADALAAAGRTLGRPFRIKLVIALAAGIAACAASSPVLAKLCQELPRLPGLFHLPSLPKPSFLAPLFQMSDARSSSGPTPTYQTGTLAAAGLLSGDGNALVCQVSPAAAPRVELPPITYRSCAPQTPFESALSESDHSVTLAPVFIPFAAHREQSTTSSLFSAALPAETRSTSPVVAPAAPVTSNGHNPPGPPETEVVVITPSESSPWSHLHDPISTVTIISPLPSQPILENDGQVISASPINIKNYSSYLRITHNPAVSGNTAAGWFAMNGGRIYFPTIHVTSGTGTYICGDDPTHTTPDLINAVRLTFNGVSRGFDSQISLLAPDPDGTVITQQGPHGTFSRVIHNGLPALPQGHHFFGVWSIDDSAAITDGIDLTIRYDETAIAFNHLDETQTKLWYYTDAWYRVTDSTFFRDPANHLIGGHVPGNITFFAVSTPEPTAAFMICTAGGMLLLRRRRSRPPQHD